jgi:hypothetical protein
VCAKHHFVPKFYLRQFGVSSKQIHLYNLARKLTVFEAPLSNQCYKHDFYGNEVVEQNLAVLENHTAPVVRHLSQHCEPPEYGTEQHHLLLAFIALQALRTHRSGEQVNSMIDKLAHLLLEEDARSKDIALSDFQIRTPHPALVSLAALESFIIGLSDLPVCLLVAPPRFHFITSDNPVVLYNTYCEGIQYSGVTGAVSSGLQVFLPLSPRVVLYLQDPDVYDLRKKMRTFRVSEGDVKRLNLLQAVHAEENLYFSIARQSRHISRVAGEAQRFRNLPLTEQLEFKDVEGGSRSLIQTFSPMPNLNLNLSFVRITRNAARVALFERHHRFRPIYEYVPQFSEERHG